MKHRFIMLSIAVVFLTACVNLSTLEKSNDEPIEVGSAMTPTDPKVDTNEAKSDPVLTGDETVQHQNDVPTGKIDKPAVEVNKPVAEVTKPKPKPKTEVQTIGQIEYVDILPEGIRQKARVDTGAETTSLGAFDIEPFERDGKAWVKFKVLQRSSGEAHIFSKPIARNVLIKRHGAKNVRRPVIKMTLAMGSIKRKIEVSLTDRSKFEFPVLIGRNFLYGDIRIDINNKFLMLDK